MTEDARRYRPSPPTWARNLIAAAWMSWWSLPGRDRVTRLSAAAISSYLNEKIGEADLEPYFPEVRTIQRLIANFRDIHVIGEELAFNRALPFREDWPTGSDDTAFLCELYRIGGDFDDSRRPDPSATETTYDVPGYDVVWRDVDGREMASEIKAPSISPPERSSLGGAIPFSLPEIEVALLLKGALGWPQDFRLEGKQRKRWYMPDPIGTGNRIGEVALIKEIALRKEYEKSNPSYLADCSDLLGIIIDRPWLQEDSPDIKEPGYNYPNWDTGYTLRWNSLYSMGPNDSSDTSRLRDAVDEYVRSGDDRTGRSAREIINDIRPPHHIREKIWDVFKWKPHFRWLWDEAEKADMFLEFADAHGIAFEDLIVEETQSKDENWEPHAPETVRTLGSLIGGVNRVWVPLTKGQLLELAEEDITRVWCAGCQRHYILLSALTLLRSRIFNLGLGNDDKTLTEDVGLMETVFLGLLERSLQSGVLPHAEGLLRLKYSPNNSEFTAAHEPIRDFLKALADRLRSESEEEV